MGLMPSRADHYRQPIHWAELWSNDSSSETQTRCSLSQNS